MSRGYGDDHVRALYYKGLCQDLVVGMYARGERVLGIKLGQPCGLLRFVCEVEHPSEAVDVNGF